MPIFTFTILWITIAPTYYGLMYAISFITGYIILSKRKILSDYELDTLLIYMFFWVVLGGRLGDIFFYDFNYFLQHPAAIIQIRNGWMSFHGWLIWVILSVFLFSWRYKISFWKLIDELAAITPIGLGLWRIGNYINKELLWFPYHWPLAVTVAWHSYFPSPLVEAFLEGLVLYFLLRYVQKRKTFIWQTSAFFLIIYGTFRILVEVFIRAPDSAWYILWPFSLWAILCFPMLILWIYLLVKFSIHSHSKKTKS